MKPLNQVRTVHVLIAGDGISQNNDLLVGIKDRLKENPGITVRGLTFNHHQHTWLIEDDDDPDAHQAVNNKDVFFEAADELVSWSDLLVAYSSADTIAKMLCGITDNMFLAILRSWDVSKKIILIPGMARSMWTNPITQKQLSKIRKRWNWVILTEPILWSNHQNEKIMSIGRPSMDTIFQTLYHQVDLIIICQKMLLSSVSDGAAKSRKHNVKLPPEILTLILEYTGDWELAKSLNVYTRLPTPVAWRPMTSRGQFAELQLFTAKLEWAILSGSYSETVKLLESSPPIKWLSKVCVKLIIKFCRTDLLTYLESNNSSLFWSSFGEAILPTKASAVFGTTPILDWWQKSASFSRVKKYSAEALDSASREGFVHVLDWWRLSGLPLLYTEASLEQASLKSKISVLDWWRNASLQVRRRSNTKVYVDAEELSHVSGVTVDTINNIIYSNSGNTGVNHLQPLALKPGKSLLFAAQHGLGPVLKWWAASGINTAHEESVAHIASAHGHVHILQFWKEHKGENMRFDGQILTAPTKECHTQVLEWWKQSGYRVEYKTCDIEEALEDCIGGEREVQVRAWWAANGLNLGVGTGEWTKIKVL